MKDQPLFGTCCFQGTRQNDATTKLLCKALKASAQMWHPSRLLTFHWLNPVTWQASVGGLESLLTPYYTLIYVLPFPPNSQIEALTTNVTISGNRASKEVIKDK